MVQSGRGFRALAAAFKGAGNTLNAYESAKTTRAKEEIEQGRAEERAKRMKALLGGNPEFEGLEDSIDPITGELDPVAMELLKEKFKNKRAEIAATALAGKQASDRAFKKQEEKDKLKRELGSNLEKKMQFLLTQGIDPELLDETGISAEDLYDRYYEKKPLPKIRRGEKNKYTEEQVLEKFPKKNNPFNLDWALRENLRGITVPSVKVEDPLGIYEKEYVDQDYYK